MIASNGLSLSAIGLYRRLWRDADLIHFHYPWPMMDLLHLLQPRRAAKPIVVTYHSDVVRQRMLGRHYTPPTVRLVPRQCRRGRRHLAELLGIERGAARPSRKLSIIPVGLGDRATPDASGRDDAAAGRRALLPVCGCATVLQGAAVSLRSGATDGPAGGARRQLRARRSRSAAGERYGPRRVSEAEKEALLELCLALVLPSHLRSEAYGVVLVEAARAGRPMISCEIGTGTSFVNRDGETGLVVAPADPAALADAMRRLARIRIARLPRAAASALGRAMSSICERRRWSRPTSISMRSCLHGRRRAIRQPQSLRRSKLTRPAVALRRIRLIYRSNRRNGGAL